MINITKKLILFYFIFPLFSCTGIQPNRPEVSSQPDKKEILTTNIQEVLSPQNKTVTSSEGKITIKGVIFEVNRDTHVVTPVEGAKVEMGNKSHYNSTYTDKEGKYALPGLPFGVYNLKISKEGYGTIDDPTYKVHGNIGHLDASIAKLENIGKKTYRRIN